MIYFNKKQIAELKKLADTNLRTAATLDYKRASTNIVNDKIADIYEAATGETINRDWSCNVCTFNAYKKIGKLYLASIEAIKNTSKN